MSNKVITVLRSGGEYKPEHVVALYNNLCRSLTVPFKFCVLTDVPSVASIKGCNIIPLLKLWPGWWSKLELFRDGLFSEDDSVVYMDLDTVLIGNTDWLFEFKEPFMMLHGFRRSHWASGLMGFKGCPRTEPYDEFDPDTDMVNRGDQVFIMKVLKDKLTPGFWQKHFPKKIMSYKHEAIRVRPPEGTVVCFHGRPRPWHVSNKWVKEARA